MVGDIIHFLQLALIANGPDEGHTLSVLEVIRDGFFNLSRVFTIAIAVVWIIEAVLEILGRTDLSTSLVLYFEGEISEDP